MRSPGLHIPASRNGLLDRLGVLAAAYERRALEGRTPWALDPARETVADPGRYLVVVDSERGEPPHRSPAPQPRHRRVPP